MGELLIIILQFFVNCCRYISVFFFNVQLVYFQSLIAGISRLVNLQSLSLAMVPAFDDAALSAVCSSCHPLRVLNLNGTSVSRASGLAQLGSALADLSLAYTK